MDTRLMIGLATAGVVTTGVFIGGRIAEAGRRDQLHDPVEVRADRSTKQRPGASMLEGVATSGRVLQERLLGTSRVGSMFLGGVLGVTALGMSIPALRVTNPVGRAAGAAVLGVLGGSLAGLATLRLSSIGTSAPVDAIARDLLALGDADGDGAVSIPDAYLHQAESYRISRMTYDDPMDFAGTQSANVDWRGSDELATFDTDHDNRLDADELIDMTRSFDDDGDGELDGGEARAMAGSLDLGTWLGTRLTGIDRGSWHTSDWRDKGYR